MSALDALIVSELSDRGSWLHVKELEHVEEAEGVVHAVLGLCQQVLRQPGGLGLDDVALWLTMTTKHLHTLSKEVTSESYPLLRRTVLRTALKLASETGAWNAQMEESLQALLEALYRLHVRGAKHKLAVDFIHVSKSAGTSFCALARDVGCSPPDQPNCLLAENVTDDWPRWLDPEPLRKHFVFSEGKEDVTGLPSWVSRAPRQQRSRDYCEERRQVLQEGRYGFVANEFVLRGGSEPGARVKLCGDLFNVLLLRDPVKRVASNMAVIMQYLRSKGRKCEQVQRSLEAGALDSMDDWLEVAPYNIDNLAVRQLLGEASFFLPAGSLNQQHLQAAQLLALQLDLLLVVEDDPRVSRLASRYGLGWHRWLDEYHMRQSFLGDVRRAQATVMLPLDLELVAQRHNTLAMELYDFSWLLAKLDQVMFAAVGQRAEGKLPPPHPSPASGPLEAPPKPAGGASAESGGANGISGASSDAPGVVGWREKTVAGDGQEGAAAMRWEQLRAATRGLLAHGSLLAASRQGQAQAPSPKHEPQKVQCGFVGAKYGRSSWNRK